MNEHKETVLTWLRKQEADRRREAEQAMSMMSSSTRMSKVQVFERARKFLEAGNSLELLLDELIKKRTETERNKKDHDGPTHNFDAFIEAYAEIEAKLEEAITPQ